MGDNLGQTDGNPVAVTLTHNTNIILSGTAFKWLVIFEKDIFWMQKKICSGSHNVSYYDNKLESAMESLGFLDS